MRALIDGKDEIPARTSRRERQHGEIRRRLIRAGVEILQTRGFHATRVSEIAERADLGHGTFYNYFPTKGHLLVALTEWSDDHFLEQMKMIREGQKTVKEVLSQRLKGSPWAPIPLLSCLSVVVADDEIRPLYLKVLQSNRKKLQQLIALGQKLRQVRSDLPAAELARMLQYAFYGAWLVESFEAAGLTDNKLVNVLGVEKSVNTHWGTFWQMFYVGD
jgi:AcrR family transcriptional regulator